jgi:hypothetical protein
MALKAILDVSLQQMLYWEGNTRKEEEVYGTKAYVTNYDDSFLFRLVLDQ